MIQTIGNFFDKDRGRFQNSDGGVHHDDKRAAGRDRVEGVLHPAAGRRQRGDAPPELHHPRHGGGADDHHAHPPHEPAHRAGGGRHRHRAEQRPAAVHRHAGSFVHVWRFCCV